MECTTVYNFKLNRRENLVFSEIIDSCLYIAYTMEIESDDKYYNKKLYSKCHYYHIIHIFYRFECNNYSNPIRYETHTMEEDSEISIKESILQYKIKDCDGFIQYNFITNETKTIDKICDGNLIKIQSDEMMDNNDMCWFSMDESSEDIIKIKLNNETFYELNLRNIPKITYDSYYYYYLCNSQNHVYLITVFPNNESIIHLYIFDGGCILYDSHFSFDGDIIKVMLTDDDNILIIQFDDLKLISINK